MEDGRSVGSWMACGGCQGWSGARVLGINRGSRHFTFGPLLLVPLPTLLPPLRLLSGAAPL